MLKPGDHLCLNREGKVFLTQYTAVSAFVSISRTLGADPEAEVAVMQATLDRMFHEQVRRNLLAVSNATEAVGPEDGGQAERLLHYLDQMVMRDGQGTQEAAGGAQGTPEGAGSTGGAAVRKKRTPS